MGNPQSKGSPEEGEAIESAVAAVTRDVSTPPPGTGVFANETMSPVALTKAERKALKKAGKAARIAGAEFSEPSDLQTPPKKKRKPKGGVGDEAPEFRPIETEPQPLYNSKGHQGREEAGSLANAKTDDGPKAPTGQDEMNIDVSEVSEKSSLHLNRSLVRKATERSVASSRLEDSGREVLKTAVEAEAQGAGAKDTGEAATEAAGAATKEIAEECISSPPISAQAPGRRRVKPSYFDRRAEEIAKAFEELPAQKAVASVMKTTAEPTPRPRKARISVGSAPPSAAQKLRVKKPTTTAPTTPKTPKKTTSKAPTSTATRMESQLDDYQEQASSSKGAADSRGWKKGLFTDAENERLTDVMDEFCEETGLPRFKTNAFVQDTRPTRGEDGPHRELWQRLLRSCPRRHRKDVIARCRKIFHNFVARGTWTREQDQELREMVELKGQRWTEIGRVINRHPMDVKDRWRNYIVCGEARKSDFWSQEEESVFVELVLEAINLIQESRGQSAEGISASAERDVAWDRISAGMNRTRSAKQCRAKWQQMREHQRRIVDGELDIEADAITQALEKTRNDLRKMTPADKYRLIKAIKDTGVGVDSKIPWRLLGDTKFRKLWTCDALRIMWYRLRRSVDNQQSLTTRNVARKLLDQYAEDGLFNEIGDSDADDKFEISLLEVTTSSVKTYRTPRKWTTARNGNKARRRPSSSPEIPASPDIAARPQPKASLASSIQIVLTGNISSQEEGEGEEDEDSEGARRETESIDLSAPPSKADSPEAASVLPEDDDSNDDVEVPTPPSHQPARDPRTIHSSPRKHSTAAAHSPQQPSTASSLSRKRRRGSLDMSSLPRVNKLKKNGGANASTSTDTGTGKKRKLMVDTPVPVPLPPRPPAFIMSASSRKTSTPLRIAGASSVYDDIEDANGEEAHRRRPVAPLPRARSAAAAALQREREASQSRSGQDDDSGMDGDQAAVAHSRKTRGAAVTGVRGESDDEEDASEAERRRLADLESDEDSDMEDIPATLPQVGAEE